MEYICHKCGIKTNAMMSIFHSLVFTDDETMIKYLTNSDKFNYLSNYYANYYITWLCTSCYSINLNKGNNSEPLSIIPIYKTQELSKYWESINDDNLKTLISDFFKCIS